MPKVISMTVTSHHRRVKALAQLESHLSVLAGADSGQVAGQAANKTSRIGN